MILWMSNLFTLQYGPYFVAGFGCSWGWHWLRCKMKHKPSPRIKWNYLAGIASALVFLWVAITTQQNANCVHEFNQVLRVRSQISEDNDKWSREQRTALAAWLHDILAPPPEIAEMRAKDPGNPKVTEWAFGMTTKYSNIIQNAQHEQDDNMAERANHPLPTTTCKR